MEHVTAAHWLGHIKEEKVAIKLQNAPLHPISRFVQMCCTSFQFEKHKIQNNITTNTIKQSQQMQNGNPIYRFAEMCSAVLFSVTSFET